MKWIKKYSFFLMILVSGMCYGTGKIIKSAETCHQQQMASVLAQETSEKAAKDVGRASEQLPKDTGRVPEQLPKDTARVQEQLSKDTGRVPEQQAEDAADMEETKEFRQVELDYLKDALFIGDSRTSTLYEYAGWEQTDFFVKYGLTIWDVWDETMDGKSLEDVLAAKRYGKIYIMLGVNELGNGTAESYRQQFESVIAQLREKQPGALVFVEAILHVSGSKDAEGTYINNAEINARNQELLKLADNKRIFYLDANEVLDDPQTGTLKEDCSFDGVHLKVKYIPVWQEFLLEHGI